MRILYSWTGYRELKYTASKFPELKEKVEEYIRDNQMHGSEEDHASWLRCALREGRYDKVIVIMDYRNRKLLEQGEELRRRYQETLRQGSVVPVVVECATDYAAVYSAMKEVLEKQKPENQERYFLLSSGTYAMTTSWILLGKTLFNGAFFLLDVGGKLQEITVPFNMEVDLLPKLLERRERFSFPLPSCFENIIGDSLLMQAKKREAYKAAMHNVPVLLVGESGTGKEVFAQAIHHASSRREKNFEAVNCGGIPANLLEDMLFGHCKGAFTGASSRHLGLVERADGGTLFLDELGELPAEMQPKLLRFLQPPQGERGTLRNFVPVGGEQLCTTDVRVIAATNRNILQMVRRQVGEANSFRMDLFQRIGTIIIELPPLREHKEDVLPLAQAFLDRINKEFRLDDGNYHDKKFSDDAINYLMECSWKDSNVRGLQNAVYRGATMSEGEWIRAVDLGISSFEPAEEEQSFPLVPPGGGKVDLECIIDSLQRRWINEALKRFPRNSTKAAEWLGLKNYQTLRNKMRKLGINHDFRS